MKRFLPFALLLLSFTLTGENTDLVDKRWYFGFMRLNGQIMEPPLKVPAAKRPWMYFGKDHTYQQAIDGIVDKGIWSYNEESKKLTTNVTNREQKPEVTTFEIKRVTADSLELVEPEGTVMGFVSK